MLILIWKVDFIEKFENKYIQLFLKLGKVGKKIHFSYCRKKKKTPCVSAQLGMPAPLDLACMLFLFRNIYVILWDDKKTPPPVTEKKKKNHFWLYSLSPKPHSSVMKFPSFSD